jgi:imidazoleglycerol-phosphate dehydratase
MGARATTYARQTKETKIELTLDLDGTGLVDVKTGLGFADHMLTLLGYWAGFDLRLFCQGDLEVDSHHSLEDIGLSLGHALAQCLSDKSGVRRVGWARVPMDEALADVSLDMSGRPYLVYEDALVPALVAGDEKDVWREFFKSFAFNGRFNLHIRYLYGLNGHHLLESAFKGVGLALRDAISAGPVSGAFSTKGSLHL